MNAMPLRIGLIVNPVAGSGGPLARKGSDALATVEAEVATRQGRAKARVQRALTALRDAGIALRFYGFDGAMAADVLHEANFDCEVIGAAADAPSTAQDTRRAVDRLLERDLDLLLFGGGDGTARDICTALGESKLPVLGIPAGVKMHSGVFAVSPEAVAEIVIALAQGDLVDIGPAEVRDIDETAFREGKVVSRHFGELLVPRIGGFLQHTKEGGREVEALAVADIAAEVVAEMDADALYIIGPGSTTAAIMAELGLANTLLGVDVVCGGELVASDVDAATLLRLLDQHGGETRLIITAIGGQGHVLGRGNQQLSPAVLTRIGRDNIVVVATKTKLTELEGRPLLVDTNDAELDARFAGLIEVITGYRDRVLYPLSAGTTR